MYCTNCGKPIQEGSKFCFNCGNPIRQTVFIDDILEDHVRSEHLQKIEVRVDKINLKNLWHQFFESGFYYFTWYLLGIPLLVFTVSFLYSLCFDYSKFTMEQNAIESLLNGLAFGGVIWACSLFLALFTSSLNITLVNKDKSMYGSPNDLKEITHAFKTLLKLLSGIAQAIYYKISLSLRREKEG